MFWEHQLLLTEHQWVPTYHPFKVVPLVWSYALFQTAQLNGSSPLPMLTSTPISGHGSRDTSQVKAGVL